MEQIVTAGLSKSPQGHCNLLYQGSNVQVRALGGPELFLHSGGVLHNSVGSMGWLLGATFSLADWLHSYSWQSLKRVNANHIKYYYIVSEVNHWYFVPSQTC